VFSAQVPIVLCRTDQRECLEDLRWRKEGSREEGVRKGMDDEENIEGFCFSR
jgi:hypothetical protein